MKKIRNTRTYP